MRQFSRYSRTVRALCGDMMHRISLTLHKKYGKYGRYSCKPLSYAKFRLKRKPCIKNSCYLFFVKIRQKPYLPAVGHAMTDSRMRSALERRWFSPRQGLSGQLIHVRRAVGISGRCINADIVIRTWRLHYRLGIPHGSSALRRQISEACATVHCRC